MALWYVCTPQGAMFAMQPSSRQPKTLKQTSALICRCQLTCCVLRLALVFISSRLVSGSRLAAPEVTITTCNPPCNQDANRKATTSVVASPQPYMCKLLVARSRHHQ
jgi:hypothetical protein